MKKAIFLLLHIVHYSLFTCFAQVNLVKNPSFEDTVRCPSNTGQMIIPSACQFWYDPAGSSSDYFNACHNYLPLPTNWVGIPENLFGWQYAKSGVAYAGFANYNFSFLYREYIQQQLDSVLIINHKYCIQFYLSLANKMNIATNNIGIYITDTTPPAPTIPQGLYSNCIPQINATQIINDTAQWTQVSGTYIAHGGEQFITIGNFYADSLTDTIYVAHYPSANYTYYYIDDISIIDCTYDGVNEKKKDENISIYPNPSSGKFQVTSSKNKVETVRVMDVMGREIKNYASASSATAMEIDMSGFAKGIYFVQITYASTGSATDKNVVNRKIVLQ